MAANGTADCGRAYVYRVQDRPGRNPPVMRCPVIVLQMINSASCAGLLNRTWFGRQHRSFPGFFRTFPVIALAWVLVPVTRRLPSMAFQSGQALFYLEIGTPKNSPDVCRRLTLSRNSANFHASLLDAPSRKQAFSPAPPDRLGAFDRSFLFPKPLNCFPDSLRKKPCKQAARPNCASTFCSYPKVAISKRFTVNQAQTLIKAQNLI